MRPREFIDATRGAADAYSVVTEPRHFCGSIELLRDFAGAPALMKDFVVSRVQVDIASCMGASAVLLIWGSLPRAELEALAQRALELGLDVLVEAGGWEDAVEAADAIPEAIIGINSRDLRTLKLDFERMLSQLRAAREALGRGRIIVAESGVDSPRKALMAADAGADAALIGTAVMRRPSLLAEIREAIRRAPL
jgi:indole-3-glycerol phosphate synthase